MVAVFLSTALIYLASKEVGCLEIDEETGEEIIVEDCNERVYGAFTPAALVANVATVSGVLIALFLPIIGAIIDFTPHRWTVGVVSATLLVLTQFILIFINGTNWIGMAILAAFSGFLFQVQAVTTVAYLPEIARELGEKAMNSGEFATESNDG